MTEPLILATLAVVTLLTGYPPLATATQTEEQTAMDDKTLLITTQAQLEKIDAEIAAQNWDVANKLLKQALIELGYRYHHSFIDDDTGMKLVKADFLEKEGKFDNAARMRRRIFAERLEMLRSKIRELHT